MRAAVLFAAGCAAFALPAEDEELAESAVVELTDATFEHDTQAATGATTGDYFVMFYAPWCGWCKRMAPDFEAAAQEARDETTFAKVDATQNTLTPARFGVSGYPTLLLFSRGQMFRYKGARDKEAFLEFVRQGRSRQGGEPVPGEVGLVGAYVNLIAADLKNVYEHEPQLVYIAAGASVVLGLMLSFVLVQCCGSGGSAPKAKAKAKGD